MLALLLEANPQLAWGELRDLVTENVTSNARTGKCPNSLWGYGKLDYAAVERLVAAAKKSVKP